MNIKLELLKVYISDFINFKIKDLDIDASQIADSTAINLLRECDTRDKMIFDDVENIQ